MSTGTFSLILLAVFVVYGHSLASEELHDEWYPISDQIPDQEAVVKFLENKILKGVDPFRLNRQFCDDPYLALCGNVSKSHAKPAHLKKAYSQIRNNLIDLLSQPINTNEVKTLSVEKMLFQKCMNLGTNNDRENELATLEFVRELFLRVLDVQSEWQNIDNQINARGFDFTFFDIGVERDPENPKESIIVIQPPLSSSVNEIYDLVTLAFDQENSEYQSNLVFKFYDIIDEEAIRQFFRRWTEVFSKSSTQRKQEIIELNKWNEEYGAKRSNKATSKIDWERIINQIFERLGKFAIGRESVIIRNKDYFFSLSQLLGDIPNNVIIAAMKTKLILENIRFIDYKYAEALRHRKRSLFCYENTNLYGASFRLLRDLKKGSTRNLKENYEILNKMLQNIADVLLYAIGDSKDLNSKEKTFLKAQVKVITSNVVKYNKYRDIVYDYYEDYEVSPSYFASIVKYRKMIKEKELTSLVTVSEHLKEIVPFSVIDLAKPRNRFIVNVFASSLLISNAPVPGGVQKEVHYGIYGVNIASFLYGLLNENQFDNAVNLTGLVDWYDHPNYPTRSLQCFVGDDVKSYGWSLAAATVSQIFGARIAYQAMLRDYTASEVKRPNNYLVIYPESGQLEELEADKLFFMAYGKYHCDLSPKVLKTVLLNLNECNYAFGCGFRNGELKSKCSLNVFQIQKKRYFSNKPF